MNSRSIVLLVALNGTAFAADPSNQSQPGQRSESTDDALFRELVGEPDTDPPAPDAGATSEGTNVAEDAISQQKGTAPAVDPQAIERILAGLRGAEEGLAAGRTGEPTQSAQQRAIDELERLIEAARKQRSRSQNNSSSESGSPQPQPAGTPSPAPSASGETGSTGAAGASTGQPGQAQSDKADDSSDQFRPGDAPTHAIRNFRYELIRDAWGHLPPRIRDQLLGAESDRYLPEYDSLVRRYFESLAQPAGAESGPRP